MIGRRITRRHVFQRCFKEDPARYFRLVVSLDRVVGNDCHVNFLYVGLPTVCLHFRRISLYVCFWDNTAGPLSVCEDCLSRRLFRNNPIRYRRARNVLGQDGLVRHSGNGFAFERYVPSAPRVRSDCVDQLAGHPRYYLAGCVDRRVERQELQAMYDRILYQVSSGQQRGAVCFLLVEFRSVRHFNVQFAIMRVDGNRPSTFRAYRQVA